MALNQQTNKTDAKKKPAYVLPDLEKNLLSLSKSVGTHKKPAAIKKETPSASSSANPLLDSLVKNIEVETNNLKKDLDSLREKYVLEPLKNASFEPASSENAPASKKRAYSIFNHPKLIRAIDAYAFAETDAEKARIKTKLTKAFAFLEKKHAS